MMESLKEYEKRLHDLYDNGVSPYSLYFKRELEGFIEHVKQCCESIVISELKLLLLDEKGLSKEESHVLTYLASNKYIVKCTKKELCECMNTCSRWILFARMSLLESSHIIRTQEYGRVQLLYIHPELMAKWKEHRNMLL